MPFRTKIKPMSSDIFTEDSAFTPVVRQVRKSRLTQLFESQSTTKSLTVKKPPLRRENYGQFEPSSDCLRKMGQNYIEDPNSEKTQQQCGGFNLCNCFSRSGTNNSDNESSDEDIESIQSLVIPNSTREKSLLRKTTALVEITDKCNIQGDARLDIVSDALVTMGYDAAICKSQWEYSQPISCPAGEYKYLDVLISGERLIIDIDFKSKFKIARPTETYNSILQSLPYIFVGKMDRVLKLVIVVSDAAKESFKKKGLHVPPWRKSEYVLTKWLSTHIRTNRIQGETSGEGGAVEA